LLQNDILHFGLRLKQSSEFVFES